MQIHSRRPDPAGFRNAIFCKGECVSELNWTELRSDNEGIIFQVVQQSAFKHSHYFLKAVHMLEWMNNCCKMTEKCQYADDKESVLLKIPACRNHPHGKNNRSRLQSLVPESDLSWETGREVHTQVALCWLLRLLGWTKAHWSTLQREKHIQLVNSTTWLNKQFPRWKKNLPRDAFGISGQHTGKENKAEIVPGEHIENVTLRPVSTRHHPVPGGCCYSLQGLQGLFIKKKLRIRLSQ